MKKVLYYHSKFRYKCTDTFIVDGSNEIVDAIESKITNIRRFTLSCYHDNKSHTFKIGIAECNPIDNFEKSTGRNLSYKNAVEDPILELAYVDYKSTVDMFISTARNLEKLKRFN